MATQATVLFDGVCNLCNASVDFIINRDPRAYFRFAALQSDAAKALGEATHGGPQSIVLIEDGKRYEQSAAALRIARRLSGAWPLLWIFIVVPRPVRDALYRFVARKRYAWFGRSDECRIPTPELKARFLS
jgi:predicted DCC family thiol-disulfide oxidoreductase YuxK